MKVLTFDIEEWFHVLDHPSTKNEQSWSNFEYRLEKNMENILEVLDRHNQKATFFCLGWLAKEHKHILKKIDALGFEIASHSTYHQLVYMQSVAEFEKDLGSSIHYLEDITGKKVRAYRAPGFSVKRENRWFFESLQKYGIEIDCSVFPARRAHGGFEHYACNKPSLIQTNHGSLKEFPMNTVTLFHSKFVVTGGGYFRLFPALLVDYFIQKSEYTMTYFHPHDFDPHRPLLHDLPLRRKFKAQIGLKGAMNKLENIIQKFDFIDLDEADKRIKWESVPIITLPERRHRQRLHSEKA